MICHTNEGKIIYDLEEFAKERIAAQELQSAKNRAKLAAKENLRSARAAANRAEGLKLPEATSLRVLATEAQGEFAQATNEHEWAVRTCERAIKREKVVARENANEVQRQEKLAAYDVTIGYDSEFIGVAYVEGINTV